MNVNDIDKKIAGLQKLKKFLVKNTICDEDIVELKIFKKYVELENVKAVAEYINGLGYRLKASENKRGIKERKYTSNDISNILKNKNAKIDRELKNFTMKLFKKHKSKILN